MDKDQLWEKACVFMRSEMTSVTYDTWIASALKPLDFTGDQMIIEAMTDFYFQFVSGRYLPLIENALEKAAGRRIRAELMDPERAKKYRARRENAPAQESTLNPKYTFESFVVGNNNRFAHAASLAVAESPAGAYNPLFIYGGVGLGKTHLLHAIGHFALSQRPDIRVRYVTTETFTNEMIAAIQSRNTQEFRAKYRTIDILLVDDIQFLVGREATQEEFFHTFNDLHSAGKQIVLSSDKPPKEIPKLAERLRSRFEWGLVADIAKPDLDTRYEILRRKTENDGITVPPEVLRLVAEKISSNIRELEGALTRLVAYSSLTGRTIDTALAETALKDTFAASAPRNITCEDVIGAVSVYYNVPVDDITGIKRNKEIILPRQMAMYLCREMVELSLEMIGRAFKRDHTTVMHACQKISQEIQNSKPLFYAADDLKKQLQDRG